MGFGVQLATNNASITAFAPFGYKFSLIGPKISLRDAETLEEINDGFKKLPMPTISPDGSILSFEVKNPIVGRRYWIHYRFEKWDATR